MDIVDTGKSISGAQKLDKMIRELFGDAFGFDGDAYWLGLVGNSVITVNHVTHDPNFSTIHVNAHVVRGLKASPALCFDLMTNPNYQFNARWRLEAIVGTHDDFILMLGVDMFDLNNDFNYEEFAIRVDILAAIAQTVDCELVEKHGGRTAIDSLEAE